MAALDALPPQPIEHVLGPVDAAKYRSCLTLFIAAGAPVGSPLARWFGGEADPRTLALLKH